MQKGFGGIDEVLGQIYVLSIGLPPVGDTSPHLLGEDLDKLSAALVLLRGQANVVKRNAYNFIRDFKDRIGGDAIKLLDVSKQEIGTALQSYGLSADPRALRAAGTQYWEGNKSAAESALMVGAKSKRNAPQNPSSPNAEADNQAGLAEAAKELQAMQKEVSLLASLERTRRTSAPIPISDLMTTGRVKDGRSYDDIDADTTFDPTELLAPPELSPPGASKEQRHKLAKDALTKARNAFLVKWLEHERKHPVLTMYRDNKGNAKNLGNLQGNREQQQRAIAHSVVPKLGNIYRTRTSLRRGKLNALKLPGAVQAAKRFMKVAPGSMQDRLATDEMKNAMDGGWKDWAIAAISVGLAILTAIPTGGSSLVLGAEFAGLALDLYLLDEALDDYNLHKGTSNTNMDKARALSQREPSLTWLVVDLLGVGLGVTAVASAVSKAIDLKTAVKAGNLPVAKVIRDGLNDLGASHGVKNAGGRVYDDLIHHPDYAGDVRHAEGNEYDLSVRSTDDVAREVESSRASTNPLRRGRTIERSELAKFVPSDIEGFETWIDALSLTELDRFLADVTTATHKGAKDLIDDGIRHTGFLGGRRAAGKHEWLMVSRIRKIKSWPERVPMRLIHDARTFTDRTVGRGFRHVSRHGPGHGTMHQTLAQMIDSSDSFKQFKHKLNDWADEAMPPQGRAHLPKDLQVRIAE